MHSLIRINSEKDLGSKPRKTMASPETHAGTRRCVLGENRQFMNTIPFFTSRLLSLLPLCSYH